MAPAGSQGSKNRPPAAAGRFYDADPQRLRATVSALLAEVRVTENTTPKALIAPHAGYVYSGRVAAAAFATLQSSARTITRVVLIGPAHFVPVRGIAVSAAEAFATPLGPVPVDRNALSLVADLPFVVASDAAHAPEHALEVELPFLQSLLGSFSVAPFLTGDATPQQTAEVLRRLWGGPETLVVASSDLSHYHDYDSARRLDAATADAIERGQWASFVSQNACGFLAVAGLLLEAARRGLAARRLSLCNSGDTAGSPERVVGYGAWTFGRGMAEQL